MTHSSPIGISIRWVNILKSVDAWVGSEYTFRKIDYRPVMTTLLIGYEINLTLCLSNTNTSSSPSGQEEKHPIEPSATVSSSTPRHQENEEAKG